MRSDDEMLRIVHRRAGTIRRHRQLTIAAAFVVVAIVVTTAAFGLRRPETGAGMIAAGDPVSSSVGAQPSDVGAPPGIWGPAGTGTTLVTSTDPGGTTGPGTGTTSTTIGGPPPTSAVANRGPTTTSSTQQGPANRGQPSTGGPHDAEFHDVIATPCVGCPVEPSTSTSTSTTTLTRDELHPDLTLFPVPVPDAGMTPRLMLMGPDHAIWFVVQSDVGRLDPVSHVVSRYSDPGVHLPSAMAVGPDGGLWIASSSQNGEIEGDSITRLDPTSKTFTHHRDPQIREVQSISGAGDGAVWFAHGAGVGRIDPATGVVSTYPIPGASGTRVVVSGHDGFVWFVTHEGVVGQLDLATKAVTTYPNLDVGWMTVGRVGNDGILWFAGYINGTLVRVDPVSRVKSTFSGRKVGSPGDIAVAPDGTVWFSNPVLGLGPRDLGFGWVTKIDPVTLVVTSYRDTRFYAPEGIVVGPDGVVWFGDANAVGRLVPR